MECKLQLILAHRSNSETTADSMIIVTVAEILSWPNSHNNLSLLIKVTYYTIILALTTLIYKFVDITWA